MCNEFFNYFGFRFEIIRINAKYNLYYYYRTNDIIFDSISNNGLKYHINTFNIMLS